jgi:nucleotide-binding universal stress UspA family protein
MTRVTNVLLAYDGSAVALDAIERGVALLGPDHRFIALTVVPPAFVPSTPLSPMDNHPTLSDPALEEEVEQEEHADAAKDLHALITKLGIEAETHVVIGEPGPTICDAASELGADLLVIGSHGHGWLRRVFLGSASQHVLHHSPCPVLVIRHDDAPKPE